MVLIKNSTNNNGWTAHHNSVESGSYELVKFFVNSGIDIYLKTFSGDNCLHIAACNGHLNLFQTLINDHGFDKNMAINNGYTALHKSAQCGSYELVKFLVDKGTDIHQKIKAGYNCLNIAARNGHLDLCQNLIDDHDFDINVAANDGWTGLHSFTRSGSYELTNIFLAR